MAIAKVISSLQSSSGTSFTTSAIDTSGSDLLVVLVSFHVGFGNPATLTDSKGNTWSGLANPSNANAGHKMYYCAAPTVGTGHTFSVASSRFYTVVIIGFSGVKATSPFDVQNSNSGGGTSLATGSVTPTENNEVLVVGAGCSGAGWPSLSINSGFTLDQVDPVGGGIGGALAYYIQPTAAAINPTLTYGGGLGGGACTASIASFKEASGGGGGSSSPPRARRSEQAVNRAGTY